MLCRFVAWLARTMRPNSIKQYLNIVRILHLENGLPNPLEGDYLLTSVVKGVQRKKGNFTRKKLPITIGILRSFRSVLDLRTSQDLTFWAACLVAFFGMLRKSSLFPRHAPAHHMTLGSCTVHDWGMSISVAYSKTIQFQERQAYVALPWNKLCKDLCPASALIGALKFSRCCQATNFLFTFISHSRKHCMTYSLFTTMLTHVLERLGLDTADYSGHSLRRGGASHALSVGLPAEVIMAQGDWRSLSYLEYLDHSDKADRASLVSKMYSCKV